MVKTDFSITEKCIEIMGDEYFYVKDGLTRFYGYQFTFMPSADLKAMLYGTKILPILSDPTSEDGDLDGILDGTLDESGDLWETAPLQKGIAGGIIGELTIVSSYPEEFKVWEGHSFLVYKSYINDVLDFSGFYKGYDYNNMKEVEPGDYKIYVNEYVSIGNSADVELLGESFGLDNFSDYSDFNLIGGIYFNREIYNYKSKYIEQGDGKYSYLSNSYLSRKITSVNLHFIILYHNNNNYYNFVHHNCAFVACNSWNIFNLNKVNAKGSEPLILVLFGLPGIAASAYLFPAYLPRELKNSINGKYGSKNEFNIGDIVS